MPTINQLIAKPPQPPKERKKAPAREPSPQKAGGGTNVAFA